MKKIGLFFLVAVLIVVGIKIIVDKNNTEKISNHVTGEDHLYNISVTIKEIDDNEQKKLTTEVIKDNNFLDVGEQLIVDISKTPDYGYYQFFEKGDEIQIYFFPFQLETTGDTAKLTLDDINNTVYRSKRNS